MAIRRVMLHHRIKSQAANHVTAMGDAHPAVPAPMLTPLAQVTVNPVNSNYVTLGMEEYQPIFTADGAAVAATGPGRWDQLALAGGGLYG